MPTTPSDAPSRPLKARMKRWLLGIVLVALLLFILYMLFVLNWSYSTGERAGFVQKFSHKGVLIKTWEGELAMVNLPGTAPEKFYFTVRDDAVAEKINRAMGKRVVLMYDQHIGIPTSAFGETEYFVNDVRLVDEAPGSVIP